MMRPRRRWAWIRGLAAALALAPLVAPVPAQAHGAIDHTIWDQLLHRFVRDGRVDYAGLEAERAALTAYLKTLENAHVEHLPTKRDQLAFWINAYNACVMQEVLKRHPLKSVKQVKGFFDGLKLRVAGGDFSLNEIEERGRALGDWRIHFAVVCASSSCPPLRAEAYAGDRLDAQLTAQTREFLSDPQRGLRLEGGTLWVSRIFDWYATDFVPAKELGALRRLTAAKLLEVLAPYLPPETVEAARRKKLGLKFFDYDWSLNERRD